MKRLLSVLAVLILIAVAYCAGVHAGIRNAITDMEIWAVERYDPDHPEETVRADGYDMTVYIDLYGETYEHGLQQG